MPNCKPLIEFKEAYSYNLAFARQLELSRLVETKEIKYAVLGLEHTPVITLGKRADRSFDLQIDEETIKDLGYEIVTSERGGLATLHQPGQLVIYPILPLRDYSLGVRGYVDLLLDVTKDVLESHGVQTRMDTEKPGLYTNKGKIVFIGIRVENGISRHGIAINVSNDTNDFRLITSCGVQDAAMDQMSRYSNVDTKSLFLDWNHQFQKRLDTKLNIRL